MVTDGASVTKDNGGIEDKTPSSRLWRGRGVFNISGQPHAPHGSCQQMERIKQIWFPKTYGGYMGSRIFESVWTLTLWLLVFSSLGFGEAKAEVYPVDITHDTSGWHITPCPLPGVSGDTWRFTNSTSDTIFLFIPVCVAKQISNFYILAPEDSVDHQIGGWEG